MRSHLVSWIVAIGMATAVTGCASMKSSSGTTRVDTSDHHWLKKPPVILTIVDGGPLVVPTKYSPTETVKNTITEVLAILGSETLRQPGQVEGRRQQIEQVIRHHVNFEQMAQRSLGTPWPRLNDMERQEFVNLSDDNCVYQVR